MDLYDFFSTYTLDDSKQFVAKAGLDEKGKDVYTFYLSVSRTNGEADHRCFKLTCTPEILQAEYWAVDDDGMYHKYEDITSFDQLITDSGIGMIDIEGCLQIVPDDRDSKSDVFTVEAMDSLKCTFRNVPVEIEPISDLEIYKISKAYFKK